MYTNDYKAGADPGFSFGRGTGRVLGTEVPQWGPGQSHFYPKMQNAVVCGLQSQRNGLQWQPGLIK